MRKRYILLSLSLMLLLCTAPLCACSKDKDDSGDSLKNNSLQVEDKALSSGSSNGQQSEASLLKIADDTDQIVIVRANEDTTCTVALHERINGTWQCTIEDEGVVGIGGVGQASEGAMVTPRGAFGLGFAFGNATNPGTQMEYRQVTSDSYWVDDPNSTYYNQWVYANDVYPDWNSAEALAESPNTYKYAVFIQYNVNPIIPGAGSAFFLHCYSSVGSWGCVQTSESTMYQILQHLKDGAMIVIDYGDAVLNY